MGKTANYKYNLTLSMNLDALRKTMIRQLFYGLYKFELVNFIQKGYLIRWFL